MRCPSVNKVTGAEVLNQRPHVGHRSDIGAEPGRDILVITSTDELFGLNLPVLVASTEPCTDRLSPTPSATMPLFTTTTAAWLAEPFSTSDAPASAFTVPLPTTDLNSVNAPPVALEGAIVDDATATRRAGHRDVVDGAVVGAPGRVQVHR